MTAKKQEDVYREFIKGLWRDNPVFVQVLGGGPGTHGCGEGEPYRPQVARHQHPLALALEVTAE